MTLEKVSRRKFLTGVSALGATTLTAGKVGAKQLGERNTTYLPRILQGGGDGAPLNVITIMCDTLRYDHIAYHGHGWIETPAIDAFAAQSQLFHRAYAGGFPTVFNRSELFTGRFMYPFMGWEDLPEGEVVLAQVLTDGGLTTGLVFDTYHLKDRGFSLDRGFGSWEWIRGQEMDRHRAVPLDPVLPADASKLRAGGAHLRQHLRNTTNRTAEEDYSVAKTMRAAIEWLRRSHSHGPFYLHVDSFDPHEPWDPPQSYVDRYDPDYVGEEVMHPAYAPTGYMSAAELQHVKYLYAAEITMVDHWFGELLKEIDDLGLADRTVVILMSDHGFLFGEHGAIGKEWAHDGHHEAYPLYEELVHIPLMIRFPGQPQRNIDALAQPVDVMPTILEIMGAPDPGTMDGVSLVPYLLGSAGSPRDCSVACDSLKLSLARKPRPLVTDGQWTLLDGSAHAPSELYYLPDDPLQQNNLITTECAIARTLHAALIAQWRHLGVPANLLDPWLPAPC